MPGSIADFDREGSRKVNRESIAVIGSSHITGKENDEARLAELGYKQELVRSWSLMHNFGVSFSIISVITGITTLFPYGLQTGGPATLSVGWIIVSFFTMFVALGMAETVSAIPCAGGPYFWAAILAPDKYAQFASWCTGWFNLLGQVAITTSITFGCASLIDTLASIRGYEQTASKTLGIYVALLCSHGIINSFGIKVLRYLNNISIMIHTVGVFSLAVAVLAAAPKHQSAKFVFANFNDGTGVNGMDWSMRASPAYVVLLGILLTQYTLTGFDASAHHSEETQNAAWSAPIGVIMSVGCSSILGFFLILALLFSIRDVDTTMDSSQPVLQIFQDIFGETGATVLFVLIIVYVWHAGLFSMTSNSRMMFSFARDGALPRFFYKVDKRFQSPIGTVWLAAFLSLLFGIPSVGSIVAFAAITSIATTGLYISYGLPIMVGLLNPRGCIQGPFNIKVASRLVKLVAVGWIMFITIILCLPEINPVNSQTLNYAPVCVGIVLFCCIASWFLWARKWFVGPIRQIEEELAGMDSVAEEEESDGTEKAASQLEFNDGDSMRVCWWI